MKHHPIVSDAGQKKKKAFTGYNLQLIKAYILYVQLNGFQQMFTPV